MIESHPSTYEPFTQAVIFFIEPSGKQTLAIPKILVWIAWILTSSTCCYISLVMAFVVLWCSVNQDFLLY